MAGKIASLLTQCCERVHFFWDRPRRHGWYYLFGVVIQVVWRRNKLWCVSWFSFKLGGVGERTVISKMSFSCSRQTETSVRAGYEDRDWRFRYKDTAKDRQLNKFGSSNNQTCARKSQSQRLCKLRTTCLLVQIVLQIFIRVLTYDILVIFCVILVFKLSPCSKCNLFLFG